MANLSKGKQVEFDVAITDDGKIGFFARGNVTNEEATIALQKLIDAIGTDAIRLENVAPIERHRDDPRIQAVHDLTHERGHKH